MPFTDADVIAALTASGNDPVMAAGMLREVMASAPPLKKSKTGSDSQQTTVKGRTHEPRDRKVPEALPREIMKAIVELRDMRDKYSKPFWMMRLVDPHSLIYATYWTLAPDWVPDRRYTGAFTGGVHPDGTTQFELLGGGRLHDLDFMSTNDAGVEKEHRGTLNMRYGIPFRHGSIDVPDLIPVNLVQQYKRNKATLEALLRALMEMIPGTYGYETATVRLDDDSFLIVDSAGTETHFSLTQDEEEPRLMTAAEYYEDRIVLSPTTLKNAQTLIDGYVEFRKMPLNLAGTALRFAPHIEARRTVAENIDPVVYITAPMVTAGVIERLGLLEGDLILRAIRPWAGFYRVATVNGDMIDGDGGLYVKAYEAKRVPFSDASIPRPASDDPVGPISVLPPADVLVLTKPAPGQVPILLADIPHW
jgi:hypothetical protein